MGPCRNRIFCDRLVAVGVAKDVEILRRFQPISYCGDMAGHTETPQQSWEAFQTSNAKVITALYMYSDHIYILVDGLKKKLKNQQAQLQNHQRHQQYLYDKLDELRLQLERNIGKAILEKKANMKAMYAKKVMMKSKTGAVKAIKATKAMNAMNAEKAMRTSKTSAMNAIKATKAMKATNAKTEMRTSKQGTRTAKTHA